jgi:uncharacterized protein YjbI with pentapeptide repeats
MLRQILLLCAGLLGSQTILAMNENNSILPSKIPSSPYSPQTSLSYNDLPPDNNLPLAQPLPKPKLEGTPEDNLKILKATNICINCNLQNVNLRGFSKRSRLFGLRKNVNPYIDLTGSNLYKADVSGADFSNANLTNSYWVNANFKNTIFYKANLTNANLTRTDLTQIITEPLSTWEKIKKVFGGRKFPILTSSLITLTGADLTEANLSNLDLALFNKAPASQYVILKGANLDNTDLYGANLTGFNLRGARLNNTRLERAIVKGADFQGAHLTNANLQYINGSPLNEKVTNLREADLTSTNFRSAKLISADLQRAILNKADLRNADLTSASLTEATLIGTILAEKVHTDYFDATKLISADLSRANLTGAILEPTSSEWEGLIFDNTLWVDGKTLCASANAVSIRSNKERWGCFQLKALGNYKKTAVGLSTIRFSLIANQPIEVLPPPPLLR